MTQDEVTDTMLMALADGELPEAQAAALMARIARDPALAARYAVFAETRAALAAALDPGPVPERLVRAIEQAGTDAPGAVLPFRPRRPAWRAAGWGALAAGVLLAVGLGGFETGRRSAPEGGPVQGVAAVEALAGVPTGGEVALADGGSARALASFDTDAGLCRLIATAPAAGDGAAQRIIACRAGGAWQVVLSVTTGAEGSFATASDVAVDLVETMLDALGAALPLDPEAEAARLREGG